MNTAWVNFSDLVLDARQALADHPTDCPGVVAGTNAVDTSSKTITSNNVLMDGTEDARNLAVETPHKSFACVVDGARFQRTISEREFST